MALQRSVLDLEYVMVPVSTLPGVDPTSDVVEFAFEPTNADPTSWTIGSWETINSRYFARCLVGPGGDVTLSVDGYWVWVRVTDNPEIIVRRVGRLRICGEEGS